MSELNFPSTTGRPTDGSFTYTANDVVYAWDGEKWTANSTQGLDGAYVNVDGDTMTGDLTVPNLISEGDVQTTSLNGGPLAGLRNLLVNGDFRIWQRGSTATAVGGTNTYQADRWECRGISGGSATQEINLTTNTPKHRLIATGVTAGVYLRQKIEAQNIRKLAGKQVTFSVGMLNIVPHLQVIYFDSSGSVHDVTIEAMGSTGVANKYSTDFYYPECKDRLWSYRARIDYSGLVWRPNRCPTQWDIRYV